MLKQGVFVLEKRKIQKVGESTLSVSLPKEWLSNTGVKVGDTVYLDYGKDGSLKILSTSRPRKEEPSQYNIDCDYITDSYLLERLVVGSYMLGKDIVRIHSSNRITGEQIEEVRNMTRRLVGLSILEESKNEIVLQCTIDATKLNTYSLLGRMSVIVSTMLSESLEALLQLNAELAKDVIKREEEANNVYWLITRLLLSAKTEGASDEPDPNGVLADIDTRLISKSLERVADCSESIAKIVLELQEYGSTLDGNESEKMVPLERLTKDLFQKSMDALLSGNLNKANQAINLRIKLDSELEARTRVVALPNFRAIAIMLAMIAENSTTIASVAINNEMKKSDSFPASPQLF